MFKANHILVLCSISKYLTYFLNFTNIPSCGFYIFLFLALLQDFTAFYERKQPKKNQYFVCSRFYNNTWIFVCFMECKRGYGGLFHRYDTVDCQSHHCLNVVACLLHATSAIQDKFIMRSISTNQMQFWFMLFSAILFWIFFFIICIKEKKMLVKKTTGKIGLFIFFQ